MLGIGPITKYDWSVIIKIFTNLQVDIGILFYAISTIFWLIALSKKDLGYAYPFIAGTYILVLGLSYFILGEHFGIYRAVGAGVVLLGLLIIVKGGG
jgi:drug/metabolite transporter (DMT)-like permease